jgi:hypothetical protein
MVVLAILLQILSGEGDWQERLEDGFWEEGIVYEANALHGITHEEIGLNHA